MTIYAHVSLAGQIDGLGQPPDTQLYGGVWFDLRPRDPQVLASAGWIPVTTVARPADTATHTFDRTVQLSGGVATEVWVQRPKTAAEITAATAQNTETSLRTDPQSHIDALLAAITALNAIANRTNTEINANPAVAIKDVTREVLTVARRAVRLARLELGVLDSTNTG